MKLPFINKFKEARAAPIDETIKAFMNGEDIVSSSNVGLFICEESAMRTSAVYACVRVLAETVASLPFPLYKRLLRGKEKAIYHPLYSLLHDVPNHEMTSFSFRETMMTYLLLWGNAYALIQYKGKYPTELWPLHPSRVYVDRHSVTKELVYKYSDENDMYEYSTNQILHIPGLSYNGITGLSPVGLARQTIGLAQATEEFGSRFFSNGARPGGILEHPGIVKDPEKLRKSWEEVYKGVRNSHKIAVLEEGMQYKEIGIPPNDAQFLETRKFQLNEICRMFRVPPHLVGDLERATFSNIEHQSIDFVVHTIRPWLVRWEQAIQRCLISEGERSLYFAKFTVDGLLRGDFKTRMDGYAVGRQNGWYSANDIREFEDLNPISEDMGGDLYLVNGNMMTATAALKVGKGGEKDEQEPDGTQNSGANGTESQ